MKNRVKRLFSSIGKGSIKLVKENQLAGVIAALVLIFVISCFISENFLTVYNMQIMVRSLAFVGIVAIGQGLLLLLGDIDLSVGAIAGLCGVITGKFAVTFGVNPFISILIGLVSGAALGMFNGILITSFNLNA